MRSPPVLSVIRIEQSLIFCALFCRQLLAFCPFPLVVIELSVLIPFTASHCLPSVALTFSLT